MSELTEDIETLKAVLKATREKLISAVLVNTELEAIINLKDQRIVSLENTLKTASPTNTTEK